MTEHVDGVLPDGSARTLHDLGELLGRLQSLPGGSGAVLRAAGSLHHWSPKGGGPREDLAVALRWLDDAERLVPAHHWSLYDSLRAQVARTDDGHDLPHAFVHPDFHRGNVIATPDAGLVVVDWTGAGRGPRITALGVLLHTAVAKKYPGDPPGSPDLGRVDAVVAGYRRHVRLEVDELARLADALRIGPLVFACWLFHGAMAAHGAPPTGTEWWPRYDLAEAIAARATALVYNRRR